MRYSSKRNYLYPVLRPYSNDYVDDIEFKTKMVPDVDYQNNILILSLEYEISASSVKRCVQSKDAVCAAMLYCRTTNFRTLLKAEPGDSSLKSEVPLDRICNQIEVHPFVIADHDFEYCAEDIHEEYSVNEYRLSKGQPLATDQMWAFSIDIGDPVPTKSIFRFGKDPQLCPGQLKLDLNPSNIYIDINANPETIHMIKSWRDHYLKMAMVSFYIGPLIEALRALIDEDEEILNEQARGWMSTMRSKLSELGRLPLTSDTDLFEVAQELLENPYGYVNICKENR